MHADLTLPLDRLPDPLPIPRPVRTPLRASIRPPGSKSLTNRALLLAALARGESRLLRPLVDADDARRMLAALVALGATIREEADQIIVQGVDGRWRPPPAGLTLDLNNAGTATRFLTAAAILSPSPITIDGNARMRQRPIGELIASLRVLGVEADHLGAPDCPPVRLIPPERFLKSPTLDIPTTLSSQFVSALLLVAPWIPGGLTVRLHGEITSASYVQMTLGLLDRLGASVRASEDLRVIRVGSAAGDGIPAFTYDVEPDASGATYFWAAAMLFPGSTIEVPGLDDTSLQGDARFPDLLERMGATIARTPTSISVRGPASLAPIDADLSLMPDTAMTLAAVACFATGPSILRGLRTLRVKETDRIEAMRTELAKVGVRVTSDIPGDPHAIRITPPATGLDAPTASRVEFDTYDDHRMAMSLALIALRRPSTFIRDPRCVAKTYATFWRDLAALEPVRS